MFQSAYVVQTDILLDHPVNSYHSYRKIQFVYLQEDEDRFIICYGIALYSCRYFSFCPAPVLYENYASMVTVAFRTDTAKRHCGNYFRCAVDSGGYKDNCCLGNNSVADSSFPGQYSNVGYLLAKKQSLPMDGTFAIAAAICIDLVGVAIH